ncbi:cytochrome c551 [Sporosarcina sp. FSL K6-1522]|uniref:cytochrome c551 n=1 Tax=Sporosarcina sp. FSL K6-1522 TaxID=2921554 RepID=UPI00315A0345
MKKQLLAVLFGATLVLGACGGGDKAKETDKGNTGGETAAVDAEAIVDKSCIMCHGGNLEGQGNAPALTDVGSRLTEEEIKAVIVDGRGGMPAVKMSDEESTAVAQWLAEKK